MYRLATACFAFVFLFLSACGGSAPQNDPGSAEMQRVDRFSSSAGMLMVRTDSNGLPAAGAPIDFDRAPFVTSGLSPSGQVTRYYNFDVQRSTPAPIYVLFREGESMPVAGQLNVVDVVPGDVGYSD